MCHEMGDHAARPEDLKHLVDAAAAHTVNYTIGFVQELGEGPNTRAILSGSGTLVSYGRVYGILTADHCITNFSRTGRLGLITLHGMKLHRFILEKNAYETIRIAAHNAERKEPDLGFIRLNAVDISTLKSTKSFVNLEWGEKNILPYPAPPLECFWGISGVIDEWTSADKNSEDGRPTKIFGGMCGVGVLGRRYDVDDYDFVEFEIEYGEGYEGPIDYSGLSGGGLWRFAVARNPDGTTKIGNSTLRGVAFYQSDIDQQKRQITCHAEQSVYRKVISSIKESDT